MTTIYCKLYADNPHGFSSNIKTPNSSLKVNKISIDRQYDIGAYFPISSILPLFPDHFQTEVTDLEPFFSKEENGGLKLGSSQYDKISVFIHGFIPDLMNLCAKYGIGGAFFETHSYNEKSEWWFCRALLASIYVRHGFHKMLSIIRGEYSVILLDERVQFNPILYVATDRIGVAPIYKTEYYKTGNLLLTNANTNKKAKIIEPGYVESYAFSQSKLWIKKESKKYFSIEKNWFDSLTITPFEYVIGIIHYEIRALIPSNKKVVCMISGGLFSSVMAVILASCVPNLTTCFVGEKTGARGYQSAMILSEKLKTNHINILVDEYDFCRSSSNIIYLLKTAEIQTVRDGCVHYIAASELSSNNLCDENATIFLGEGGANIFQETTVEEEYDKLINFGAYFKMSPRRIPEKTDKLVKAMDQIYRHTFGYNLRFPFFTSKLIEFVYRREFARSDLIEWLAHQLPQTYSEYSKPRPPVVSAMPIGIIYDMTMANYAKMDEQSYYNQLLCELA